jgi:hypothetical protein
MKSGFSSMVVSLVATALFELSGCAARHEVLAVTETNLGVDVVQTPSTQTPHAKFGYQRVEVAIVPTNRSAGEDAGNVPSGAASNADVIMELRYSGIFSTGKDSGLYQRLAVGREAVQQPGAAALFIRDASGNVDANAVAALQALKKAEMPVPSLAALKHLTDCYWNSPEAQAKIKAAAGGDLRAFIDSNPTAAQIDAVSAAAGCK